MSPSQPEYIPFLHALPKPSMTLHLQIWISMRLEGCPVCPWLHHQAAVVLVSPLHGGPGAHDAGRGPEREIVQVLVHGVQECLHLCNTAQKPHEPQQTWHSLFLPGKPLWHVLRSCCFSLETLGGLSACSSPAMEGSQAVRLPSHPKMDHGGGSWVTQ